MSTLEEYREELMSELRADASIAGTDTEDEFITRALQFLDDYGELSEPTELYFGKRGRGNRFMQINGYAFDDADSSLCLVISDFQDTDEPGTLINTQIDTLTSRINYFLEEVWKGTLAQYCDDSDEILPLAAMLRSRLSEATASILKIKYFIITNKTLSNRVTKLKEKSFNDIPVEVHLWSIERFWQQTEASSTEPIQIDFERDFSSPGIPCIKGNIGEDLDYEAYIAIIPGKLLASLYIEHGSRLLEGNVRAFLGASGAKSVNAGIRSTILNNPQYFFTYNNGIACTASEVHTVMREGGLYITYIEDMQIINGGQTTASLAAAVLRKEREQLDGIFVPMKLTVIRDRDTVSDATGNRRYDDMVQAISRYANSQNRVTAADFFSNHPFHIKLERLSKRYLAPPSDGRPFPTGWYYERARGKYSQEMVGLTKSEALRFQEKFPKKQVITKEKLAKYLNAVNQRPFAVARGANKNMVLFADWIGGELKRSQDFVNEFFYRQCVCAAIIFEGVDTMVKKAPWYHAGGYKLNIVPYTISKIFSMIPKGKAFNWQLVWQRQGLYPAFLAQADIVAQWVNQFICDSHGMIVTEYCKKEDTWKAMRAIPLELLPEFLDSLADDSEVRDEKRDAVKEQQEMRKITDEVFVYQLGSQYWASLLTNEIAMRELNAKDISFIRFASQMDATGRLPTTAQARAILAVRQKLIDKGIISSDSRS